MLQRIVEMDTPASTTTSQSGQTDFKTLETGKENLLSHLRETAADKPHLHFIVAELWRVACKTRQVNLSESEKLQQQAQSAQAEFETRVISRFERLETLVLAPKAQGTRTSPSPNSPASSYTAPSGITNSSWANISTAAPGESNQWTVAGTGNKRERDEIQREETKALNKERTVIVKISTAEGKTRACTTGRVKILDNIKRLIPQANVLAVDILASGDVRITTATPAGRTICVAEEAKWMPSISIDGKIARATYPVMAHGVHIAGLNLADHAKVARTVERDNAHNIPGLEIIHIKWLKSKNAMEGKTTASIVLDITTAEHANKVIQNSLVLNGELLRTELYDTRAEIVHCYKCLGYGHIAKICKAQDACRWCGGKHRASTCEKSKTDKATMWCKNCRSKGHGAQTRECPKEKAEKKRTKDALANKQYFYTIPPHTIDLTLAPPTTAPRRGRPVTGAPTNVKNAAGHNRPAPANQRTLQESFLGNQNNSNKRQRADSIPGRGILRTQAINSLPSASFSMEHTQKLPDTTSSVSAANSDFSLSQDSVFASSQAQTLLAQADSQVVVPDNILAADSSPKSLPSTVTSDRGVVIRETESTYEPIHPINPNGFSGAVNPEEDHEIW